ncbi:tRNA (adenosine(37)-N6)-threonylcarbamoyltransferase complex dimerization subunit type 1 TsaB [Jeotgalibaca sp. A122]|uniref:tRNA (adenosine(37)-N6)-threonylcarbamoyltransferase complex dimerization subunit type 1 TsaB n=1 Tax=Jeotgalibaca sp. A122 TaxID=3457322 RepID=UPI003FD00754
MKILAIESSNQTMSVATVENGLVVSEYTRNGNLQHSTQLMPAIETVMNGSSWQPKDIDQVVVSKGPGSYTGVRIGATIAKTLAWTLKKPLVPVSSLKLLAANGLAFEGLIIPLIDARRENIYTGVYHVENGILVQVQEDNHIDSEIFFDSLKNNTEPLLFIGQDIPIYKERLTDVFGDRAFFAPQQDWLPRAGVLANLAHGEQPVDAHVFTPEYLKKPEAEENWQKAHRGEEKGEYVERID